MAFIELREKGIFIPLPDFSNIPACIVGFLNGPEEERKIAKNRILYSRDDLICLGLQEEVQTFEANLALFIPNMLNELEKKSPKEENIEGMWQCT